tara:strand:+ start:1250 stop:2803 length:1554 start_codon:yes stop_codon:yes gene_type:complete
MPKNITVTFDDGSSHVYQNTPDTVTPEEVAQRASQEFGKRVVNMDGGEQPEPPPPPPEPMGNLESAATLVGGMPGRISSAMDQRKQEMVDVMNTPSRFPFERELQMLGKGVAGPAMDVVGEVVSTGIGAASDLADPDIRLGFNDLMNGVVNSDGAKKAIAFYQAVDPQTRRTLESIFNIANVMSPFKVKAKTGSGLSDTLESGLTVVSKGKELKSDMLRRMFQPERSKENIEFELKNGTGALDSMVEELVDIKGVSPMYVPERNLKALNKDMNATEARILGQLGSFDKTGVFVKSTRKSFEQTLVNTINNAESYVKKGVKPQESQAAKEALMRKVDGILTVLNKKGIQPNTLRGVLELRRELDAQLTPKDWSRISDAEKASLTLEKLIVKEMRGELNKSVSAFAEQFSPGNKTIQNLLKRQSAIYTATDNYASKSARGMADLTEKGAIARAFSNHPILVYRALQSQGTSPLLAAVLAAPSIINAGGDMAGAIRRQVSGARAPAIRGGMFYGQEQEQR